jgi:tripartite-type tricarboxylate transporter receptor subunit TctC
MTIIRRRAALAAGLVPVLPRAAWADWRPTQQVRIVVPAAPGGTTDIVGRMLANFLTQRWGQPAVVENRSGGGGTIGVAEIARARPDGHHILSGNIGPNSTAYALFRNLPYRPDSLIPVSNVITGPNILVVHPSLPVSSVPELVAYLKANPGKIACGNPGVGQSPHLSAAWFAQLTGTEITHVPFRGAAPAMVELIAGNIGMMFDNLTTAMPHVQAGKVRALGVTSAARNPQLPNLPALRETMPELSDYDVSTWFGIFLPAATPDPIVAELNAQIRALVALPDTQARFTQMGGFSAWSEPARFKAFVDAEIAKWTAVIEREKLQLDIT